MRRHGEMRGTGVLAHVATHRRPKPPAGSARWPQGFLAWLVSRAHLGGCCCKPIRPRDSEKDPSQYLDSHDG